MSKYRIGFPLAYVKEPELVLVQPSTKEGSVSGWLDEKDYRPIDFKDSDAPRISLDCKPKGVAWRSFVFSHNAPRAMTKGERSKPTPWKDRSGLAACMLALAQSDPEPGENNPIVLISCNCSGSSFQEANLVEVSTSPNEETNKKALSSKWKSALQCKDVLALVLHEKDAKRLKDGLSIEYQPFRKGMFDQLAKEKCPHLISVNSDQLPDLAEALGIERKLFEKTKRSRLDWKVKLVALASVLVLCFVGLLIGYHYSPLQNTKHYYYYPQKFFQDTRSAEEALDNYCALQNCDSRIVYGNEFRFQDGEKSYIYTAEIPETQSMFTLVGEYFKNYDIKSEVKVIGNFTSNNAIVYHGDTYAFSEEVNNTIASQVTRMYTSRGIPTEQDFKDMIDSLPFLKFVCLGQRKGSQLLGTCAFNHPESRSVKFAKWQADAYRYKSGKKELVKLLQLNVLSIPYYRFIDKKGTGTFYVSENFDQAFSGDTIENLMANFFRIHYLQSPLKMDKMVRLFYGYEPYSKRMLSKKEEIDENIHCLLVIPYFIPKDISIDSYMRNLSPALCPPPSHDYLLENHGQRENIAVASGEDRPSLPEMHEVNEDNIDMCNLNFTLFLGDYVNGRHKFISLILPVNCSLPEAKIISHVHSVVKDAIDFSLEKSYLYDVANHKFVANSNAETFKWPFETRNYMIVNEQAYMKYKEDTKELEKLWHDEPSTPK